MGYFRIFLVAASLGAVGYGASAEAPSIVNGSGVVTAPVASHLLTNAGSSPVISAPETVEPAAAPTVASTLAIPAEATTTAATAPREVTLPAGTRLSLRLGSPVSSAASRVEDPVTARLRSPLVVNGVTVAPAGTEVSGYVTEATRSGRVKGRARVGVRFNAMRVEGTRYRIRTSAVAREAPGTKKEDAAKIGIGAGAGAVAGAIAGGKKGAAIGTAVGAGGGTGVVLATRGREVAMARGMALTVRLTAPLTVRMR